MTVVCDDLGNAYLSSLTGNHLGPATATTRSGG